MAENVKIGSGKLLLIASIIGVIAVFVFANTYTASTGTLSFSNNPLAAGEVQQVSIQMHPLGYEPSTITLKKGILVKLTLSADNNAGCTRSIVFPDFGITKVVPRGGTATVEFTPSKTGTYPFHCSMNMAHGTIIVE